MKLEVNLSKKYFFILLGAILILAGAIYGFAYGGSEPEVMGHSFEEINFPTGTIMTFNLEDCPEGWNSADGTEGTLDLRGAFIRGIGGEHNGRDVARVLGDFQGDKFKAHTHYSTDGGQPVETYDGHYGPQYWWSNVQLGGVETRPKNVALLYCQKV